MVASSSDYGASSRDPNGHQIRTTFSYPMYQQFAADNQTMTDLIACAPYGRLNVVVDGHADIASGFISSGNYYRVLGLNANPGRTIAPEDDRPDSPPVAVISSKYWRSRFGSDPNIVGKVVRVNNVAVTIVGVMVPALTDMQRALSGGPDIAVPLALDAQLTSGEPRLGQPTYWWVQVLGRLKPGVTAPQVHANLASVFQHTARAGMDSYLSALPEAQRATALNRNRKEIPYLIVDSASHGVYDVRDADLRAVTILSVVAALVLLIVCANVANLLLSRALTRQKEISVRLSMGATRWRLVRQFLTESVVLAAIGGSLGMLVGYWGQRLLPGPPGQEPAPLDWRVLAFVMVVTLVTGIVFGLAPALRATRVDVSSALKDNSRSVVRSRSRLSKALLVVQVAVSLVLLVGAGLFIRTLQNLRRVDVGFNTRNLVVFRVSPALNRYDETRIARLYSQLIERLRAVGGVRAVGLSSMPLIAGGTSSTSMFVAARSNPPTRQGDINRLAISPEYFDTMEMRLLGGRGFTAR